MLTETLSIARKHQQEGRKGLALATFSDWLLTVISHVVSNSPTADAGLALFREIGITRSLQEFTALNRWALENLEAGRIESAVINEPTLLCLAWFCAEQECAAMMLAAIRSPKVQSHFPVTGFWREFAVGLVCLADRRPYDVPTFTPKGYERYLVSYLSLISDLSHGRDSKASLAEVDSAFQARNRDKRLIDWRTIDGDGKRPVRWDFRCETLLRYRPAANEKR
jgi:hypothetical protein